MVAQGKEVAAGSGLLESVLSQTGLPEPERGVSAHVQRNFIWIFTRNTLERKLHDDEVSKTRPKESMILGGNVGFRGFLSRGGEGFAVLHRRSKRSAGGFGKTAGGESLFRRDLSRAKGKGRAYEGSLAWGCWA